MHFVYIDDSRDEALCAFSALIVPVTELRRAFEQVRDFRRALKASDGRRTSPATAATAPTRSIPARGASGSGPI